MPQYTFSYHKAEPSEFIGSGFIIPDGQNEFAQRFWVRDIQANNSYDGWRLQATSFPTDVSVTFGWDYSDVNMPSIDLPIRVESPTIEFFVKVALGENAPNTGLITLSGEIIPFPE